MGAIGWLLGIEVTRATTRTLSLSQRSYVETRLARGNFTHLSLRASPMDCSTVLSRSQCPTSVEDAEVSLPMTIRDADVGRCRYPTRYRFRHFYSHLHPTGGEPTRG